MVITLAKEHRKRAKRRLRDRPEKLDELKGILADFEQFCWRMLKIKTKSGRIMPLMLNGHLYVKYLGRSKLASLSVLSFLKPGRFRQIADLDIIKYLKYMGASLEEIRHIMKMSPESLCEFLDKQEFTINEQIQKLNNIQKLLTHHKNHIREQTRINNQEFGIIYHRDIDERSVLKVNCNNIVTPLDQADIYFRILSKTLENEDTIMAPLCGYIYPLKNYKSIEKIHYSSLYTSTTKMDLTSLPSDVHVDSIPKGTYMCIAFKWSVTEYYKYFCKLKKAYDLLGLSKENNVYEVSVPNNYAASNDKDFITELQIKID